MRKRLALVALVLLALVSLAGSVEATSGAAATAPTIDLRLDHFFMDMTGDGCGGG